MYFIYYNISSKKATIIAALYTTNGNEPKKKGGLHRNMFVQPTVPVGLALLSN